MTDYSDFKPWEDGWFIAVKDFPEMGLSQGVCIWNGKEGAEKRRHAVLFASDGSDPIAQAETMLRAWKRKTKPI